MGLVLDWFYGLNTNRGTLGSVWKTKKIRWCQHEGRRCYLNTPQVVVYSHSIWSGCFFFFTISFLYFLFLPGLRWVGWHGVGSVRMGEEGWLKPSFVARMKGEGWILDGDS